MPFMTNKPPELENAADDWAFESPSVPDLVFSDSLADDLLARSPVTRPWQESLPPPDPAPAPAPVTTGSSYQAVRDWQLSRQWSRTAKAERLAPLRHEAVGAELLARKAQQQMRAACEPKYEPTGLGDVARGAADTVVSLIPPIKIRKHMRNLGRWVNLLRAGYHGTRAVSADREARDAHLTEVGKALVGTVPGVGTLAQLGDFGATLYAAATGAPSGRQRPMTPKEQTKCEAAQEKYSQAKERRAVAKAALEEQSGR
jgi:hypothetical protein